MNPTNEELIEMLGARYPMRIAKLVRADRAFDACRANHNEAVANHNKAFFANSDSPETEAAGEALGIAQIADRNAQMKMAYIRAEVLSLIGK